LRHRAEERLTSLALIVLLTAPLLAVALGQHGHLLAVVSAQEELVEFRVLVRVLDADGKPLPNATVEALNATSGEVITSAEANRTGWAELWIPNGTTCDIRAVWLEAPVGLLENITVLGNMTLGPLNCTVCRLFFRAVLEKGGLPLLNARVRITANYTNVKGNSTTYTEELTTGLNGTCELEHALMNASYTIRAYRRGVSEPFATVRLSRLNASTTVELPCPSLDLLVSLSDEQMRPVAGATVEAWDWGTGVKVGEASTDEHGLARFHVPFGYCLVRASVGGRVVAEEKVLVVENRTWCFLTYRAPELALRVLVRDALGRPVPGLDVKLLDQEGNVVAEGSTGQNGSVTFRGLEAGAYRVEVYSGRELLAMRSLLLRKSGKVEVELADRVMFLGHPIWLPALLTALAAILTALGGVAIILAWRRWAGKKAL